MPKVLTHQQIDDFHVLGFVGCVDVMSEDEAAVIMQKLECSERDFPELINPEKRNNAHVCFTFLDELAYHPRIVGAVEDLLGPDLSLWASVLFIKEPSSPQFVSWHQDATYMGMNSNDFVTPWLALSHSNQDTGCMSMIPGSHKESIYEHKDTFADDNILTRGQKVVGMDASTAVDLVLKPGQMSLHHGQIIHGSRPNRSKERRIGFALQSYMRPDVMQMVGDNYWLDIQGQCERGESSVSLPRPEYDAAPAAVALREKVDKNMAAILYRGAEKRRAF
ncbi:MAG: phytanoyl-CoA dioxygenase family protein [Pseudomonadota bacterium]